MHGIHLTILSLRREVPSLRRRRHPCGTTLVELTVVVVLLGLVVGGLLSVVGRQQRFYRETSLVASTRSQLRQAAAILPAELRGLGPAAGDVTEALDSALEIHSTTASGVICERGADWIALTPERSPGERVFRGELVPPEPGDLARVLVPDDDDPARDRWPTFRIVDATGDASTCPAGPFIDAGADAGRPRLRLTLVPAPGPEVRMGAPVRITRLVRYSLYRSSDRLWYLGVKEQTDGVWSGVQPVSGPYAAYGGTGGGIRFEYRDAAGVELQAPQLGRLARIALTVRSVSNAALASHTDSLAVHVALRNRRR